MTNHAMVDEWRVARAEYLNVEADSGRRDTAVRLMTLMVTRLLNETRTLPDYAHMLWFDDELAFWMTKSGAAYATPFVACREYIEVIRENRGV